MGQKHPGAKPLVWGVGTLLLVPPPRVGKGTAKKPSKMCTAPALSSCWKYVSDGWDERAGGSLLPPQDWLLLGSKQGCAGDGHQQSLAVGRAAGGVGVVSAGSMGVVDEGNVCFKTLADFMCGCRYQGGVWSEITPDASWFVLVSSWMFCRGIEAR